MAPFWLTKHAEIRMQQRGRRPKDIEFVLMHGTETLERILLTRQDVDTIEQKARRVIAMALKLQNVFVPCEGGTIKTVFKASSAQQSRML